MNRTTSRILVFYLFAGCSAGVSLAADPAPGEKASRWESAIAAFEKKDQAEPPPKDAFLFVGSSSIRMWNLPKSFGDLAAINRGFGGSQIADSIQFADRIIFPHRPKVVILYAGDNDVAAGKSPERVAADFRKFVATVRGKLPAAKIVFIAIKPSVARWRLVEKMRDANARIKKITEDGDLLEYVDIDTPMIGDDGLPRKELFADDGLHLNAAGYELWTSLVRPHIK